MKGNARTQDRVVRRIAGLRPGDVLEKENLEQARINLQKSGLFAEVRIRAEPCTDPAGEGSPAVRIILEVEDKWTLIPIPVFSSDGSSSVTGGLILIESNLAGTGKMLISGGMGGTEGFSGFAVFSDPALFDTPFKLSFSASGGAGSEERLYPDGEKSYSFDSNDAGASLGLGYQFTNRLSAALGGRFEQRDINRLKGPDSEDLKLKQTQGEVSLSSSYDATVPYGALLKGCMVSGRAVYFLFEKTACADGQASAHIPTFWNQRLRLLGAGGGGFRPVLAEESISGRDGFRTLPFGRVSAEDYWSAAAAYDVPVFSQDWGSVVISGFYEHGWYRSPAVGRHYFYGPGGGFRVYLRKLAIPALGIDAAYNLSAGQMVMSIALGMKM